MAFTKLDDLYREARQCWPAVRWPRAAYADHLAGERPRYGLDLYLAGAAGWHVKAAWQVVEEELGPEVQRILSRQPLADYTPADLWAQARAGLMEEDTTWPECREGRRPGKIIRYRGRVRLINYLVVVAKRLAAERHRGRRRIAEPGGPDQLHRCPDPRARLPEDEAGEREELGRLMEMVRHSFEQLSPEQQFLVAMVYGQGMRQRDVARMLNWSPFKTCRQLRAALLRLRASLSPLADRAGAPSPDFAAVWARSWAHCWQHVQTGRRIASVGAGPQPKSPVGRRGTRSPGVRKRSNLMAKRASDRSGASEHQRW